MRTKNNNRTKSIFILGDDPAINTGYGNTTRFMCEGFVQHGWEVFSFSFNTYGVVTSKKHKGFTVLPNPYATSANQIYGNLELFMKYYEEHEPDVIFLHNDFYRFGYLMDAPEEVKKKCFLWIPEDQPGVDDWIHQYKSFGHIVYLTKYAYDLHKEFLHEEQVGFIYQGLDFDEITPTSKAALKSERGWEDQFVICTVGRNQPRKQYPLLFEAMSKFIEGKEDIVWVIKTDPNDETGESLYKLLDRYPSLTKCVVFDQEDYRQRSLLYRQTYQVADVFTLLSGCEGFGMPFVETLACGTPAVIPDTTSNGEIIGPGGIIVPIEGWSSPPGRNDIVYAETKQESFVESLNELYLDWKNGGERLRALGIAGQEHVFKHFNLRNIVKQWVDYVSDRIALDESSPPLVFHSLFGPGLAGNSTLNPTLRQLRSNCPELEIYRNDILDNSLSDQISDQTQKSAVNFILWLMYEQEAFSSYKNKVGMFFMEHTQLSPSFLAGANTCEAIITHDYFNFAMFRHSGFTKPIYIVPWGIHPQYENKRRVFRETFHFAIMGTWDTRKNFISGIRAFESLRDEVSCVRLIVQTKDPGVVDYCRKSRHADSLECHSHVLSDNELSELYSQAHCLISPTSGEGAGLHTMEAMMTGMPVIVTNWSAPALYCTDENSYLLNVEKMELAYPEHNEYNGYWAKPDGKHLKELMEHIVSHYDEALEKGQRAHKTMLDHYSTASSAEYLAQAYDRHIEIKKGKKMVAGLTSIVVPVWNQLELTKKCIESIITNTKTHYELIIVDNGSDPETAEYLDVIDNTCAEARIFYHEENKGFVVATNRGMREAVGEFIVTLNNDTAILPPISGRDWLTILKDALNKDPQLGIVGPATNTIDVPCTSEESQILSSLSNVNLIAGRQGANIQFIGLWCAMFRQSLLEKIGFLDERIQVGYFDDVDFATACSYAGLKMSGIGMGEDEFNVTHVNQASLSTLDNLDELIKTNGTYFKQKWVAIMRGENEHIKDGTDRAAPEQVEIVSDESPLFSIITPTWNNQKVLRACVESVLRSSKDYSYEWIIIDNGSFDGTRSYLSKLAEENDQIKVITNEFNLGFAKANNQGIELSTGKYVILLNDDTEIVDAPGSDFWIKELSPEHRHGYLWLDLLRSKCDFSPEIGIVGPSMPIRWDEEVRFAHLLFWCVMMPRETIEKVGLLDEIFSPAWGEDKDYCVRVEKAGLRQETCLVPILHTSGVTFDKLNRPQLKDRNLRHFFKKWPHLVDLNSLDPSLRQELSAGKQEEAQVTSRTQDITAQVQEALEPGKEKEITVEIPAVPVETTPDTSPKHLVGLVTMYNEEDNVDRCIQNILPLVDELYILDDGSSDDTVGIIHGWEARSDNKVKLLSRPRPREWNDGETRDFLYQAVLAKTQADWFLWIDADEEYEISSRQELDDLMSNPLATAYSFDILTFWGDKETVRLDGSTVGFQALRLFRNVGSSIEHVSLHGSPIPLSAGKNIIPSGLILKHYGWVNVEDRLIKYANYRQIDPQCENQGPGYLQYIKAPHMNFLPWTTPESKKAIKERNKRVLVGIPTKNRPDSISLLLRSLLQQTHTAWDLVVIDDNDDRADEEKMAMRHHPLIKALLTRIMYEGHKWYVIAGDQRGPQVAHQKILDYAEKHKYEYILRLDDDVVIEPDYLEKLFNNIAHQPQVGAVAGSILSPDMREEQTMAPDDFYNHPRYQATIQNVLTQDCLLHVHHLPTEDLVSCEHLYSSYLYRTKAALEVGGYPKNLSQVGHREETLFSHKIYKKGYTLYLDPAAVAWHYRHALGGIRWTNGKYNEQHHWDSDEKIFRTEVAEMMTQLRERLNLADNA